MPTRNRANEAVRAVGMALKQSGTTVEVIVVDDASDSDVGALLAGFGENVFVIRHDVALGPGAARNTGIGQARAEWIAFLDDDDYWAPDKLERQLGAGHSADFVYASALAVDRGGRV